MFDVFDILVPELSSVAPLDLRRRESVFGSSSEVIAYFEGLKLAQVVRAEEAYDSVEAWTGSATRADWTVLLAGAPASEAAEEDDKQDER